MEPVSEGGVRPAGGGQARGKGGRGEFRNVHTGAEGGRQQRALGVCADRGGKAGC